ncbi:MAG: sensor histidine kinase [Cyclobacteriaceae bacterium]
MVARRTPYVLIQVVFWILLLLFSIYYLGREEQRYAEGVIVSLLYLPVVAATAYFISRYLIPRYLLQERFVLFSIYLLYTFIGSVYASLMVIITSLIGLANFDYSNLLTPIRNITSFIGIIHFFIVLFVAISVTEQWHTMQQRYLLALQEKSQAELRFLKTQLHPHFLFNTLNNLYYLTLNKSDQAPEVVLKLSQLLDYVLQQGKEAWVSLAEECERMRDFVYLESLRYQDRLKLEIATDEGLENWKFPPLLLITLVENSFKHGLKQTRGPASIRVQVNIEDETLAITVKNSQSKSTKKVTTRGIGLPNIQRQLDHLYSDDYRLSLHDLPESFTVYLTLPAYAYHQMSDC